MGAGQGQGKWLDARADLGRCKGHSESIEGVPVKGFSIWIRDQRFPARSSSGSHERFSRVGCSRHVVPICSMFVLLSCPPLMAQVLPAGTTLEVRLSNATGSSISHAGDQIEGTIIAPVSLAGQVVVPQGSRLIGSIESVKRFGLGLKHVTAAIHYRFHTLQFLNGESIPNRDRTSRSGDCKGAGGH